VKTIALITSLGVILVDLFGPKASVGGPLVMGLVVIIAMFAVGVYEAWTSKRSVVGWIVNILGAFVGGLVAVTIVPFLVEPLILLFQSDGSSLSSSHNPLKYIVLIATASLTVYAVWLTLQLVNRFRDAPNKSV
jgi:hypothetical protein